MNFQPIIKELYNIFDGYEKIFAFHFESLFLYLFYQFYSNKLKMSLII